MGATAATYSVAIVDDNTDENNGSVTATLTAPVTGAGYTLSTITVATLAVTDDDDMPVLSVAAAETTEGRNLLFPVTLMPASERTVVAYTTEAASGTGNATAPTPPRRERTTPPQAAT